MFCKRLGLNFYKANHHKFPRTLDELVKSFAECPDKNGDSNIKVHDDYLTHLLSITDYVCGAVNASIHPLKFNVDYNHQHYYNTAAAKPHIHKFIDDCIARTALRTPTFDFEQLFDEVASIPRTYVQAVGVYDFALRFGWNRFRDYGIPNVVPEKYVYLHADPLKSAVLLQLLGLFPAVERNKVNDSYKVEYSLLPPVFSKYGLNAKDVEHFLCIYYPWIELLYGITTGVIINKSTFKFKNHLKTIKSILK